MCAVSQVGDVWTDRFKTGTPPWTMPNDHPFKFPATVPENGTSFRLGKLEGEVARLREEVLQMREELRAAKQQDIENGEPDCEMDEKVKLLKQIAAQVGVSLEDVFPHG